MDDYDYMNDCNTDYDDSDRDPAYNDDYMYGEEVNDDYGYSSDYLDSYYD